MARVAIVTGGTRGIGHAISVALKEAGFKVAANYAGNDAAAQKFKEETGIPTFKWDVGDYEACAAGLKRVESELGPVEVVVNNAGITRDGMLHRLTPQMWNDVIRVNLGSMYNMTQPLIDGMRGRNWGRIVNISSINGQKGQSASQLFGRQGGRDRLHQGARPGERARASPSTASRPAISTRKWWPRFRKTC